MDITNTQTRVIEAGLFFFGAAGQHPAVHTISADRTDGLGEVALEVPA